MSTDWADYMAEFRAMGEEVLERFREHRSGCSRRPCRECGIFLCDRCGAETEETPTEVGDNRRPARCRACQEQAELDRIVAPALDSIPERYRACRFDHPTRPWKVRNWCRDYARPEVQDMVHKIVSSRDAAVFVGEPGQGKTTLAVCCLREVIEEGRRPTSTMAQRERARTALFVTATSLAADRERTRLGQGEGQLVAAAMRASVLVIDDLGQDVSIRGTAIADVINHRYNANTPTWVTTFLPSKEIGRLYGGGTLRRLVEAKQVVMLGPPPKGTGSRIEQNEGGAS